MNKPCVVCKMGTPHRIMHKETKKLYPFCMYCAERGLYNKELFDRVNYRGR